MRLLYSDARGKLSLTKDLTKNIPPFAILSHTWGADEDEVSFRDLQNGNYKNKAGYAKLLFCGNQAQKDHLDYYWVDSCCIDKSSSAELQEAINSMFRWYGNAARCYVFLSDVSARKRDSSGSQREWESAFRKSRWFTRGWTLQELLAPASVEFFSKEEKRLGDKRRLEQLIHEITTVPREALGDTPLSQFSVPERLKWAEKRKTTRIEDKAYCLLGLFDVFMSPIYGEGENAFGRLKDEIGRSYRRQLDGIGRSPDASKLLHPEKDNAELISIQAEHTSLHDCRKMLLTSLSFEQMDSRRSTIKTAYSTTCQWLLRHSAYLEWIDPNQLQKHRGFLWLNGKPGAGKSTLVKFAYAHAERERQEHEVLVSFFFNARGDELEKSTLGMYRALLYQILNKAPELQTILDDVSPPSAHQDQPMVWTTELLCELLSIAIARLGQRQLKCFIDALDECDEQQVQEMVPFFEEMGQNALENGSQLYICFASRHYPTIDIRSGLKMTLEDENGHIEDLAKYVRNNLRAGKGQYIEEVREQVQEKANGIFMWAVLVVDILNKEFRRGRIFAVKKRLQEIPTKLSDLFKDILRRNGAEMNDLLLCLQWILFATRPLRREEFYFAMVAGLDPSHENLAEWNSEQVTVDDMNRYVLNSSKGLAELTKSKAPTVQFIHESVRDFLVKDNGLCELWTELGGDLYSLSQDRLKQCCQNYMNVDLSAYVSFDTLPKSSSDSAKDLRQILTTKFPFLEYAIRNILYHADEAAARISQDDFLRHLSVETWVNIGNLFERYDIRRHTSNASLLYLLAEYGFARLIRTVSNPGPVMGVRGERYQFPLFAALANGHREAFRALLHDPGNFSMPDITRSVEFGKAFSARKDHTPLLWALVNKHEAIAQILVRSSDIDLNLGDHTGRTALSFAAENGYETIIRLLLATHGLNVNSSDKHQRAPLSYAAQQGQRNVVQQLLDGGANIDAPDSVGRTALYWAAMYGSDTTVQLLPDRGANIDAPDSGGRTALHYAAIYGSGTTVQLLLDKGANIEASDDVGRTALHLAATHGSDAMVQRLLDKGANTEATESGGRTALHLAASNRSAATVQLLLDKGANIEAVDYAGKTALLRAAAHRSKATLQLLLDQGANIEVCDQDGRTPLSHAAGRGFEDGIRLLLAQNANVSAEDKAGKTPLMWLVGQYCNVLAIDPLQYKENEVKHCLELGFDHRELGYETHLRLLEQQNMRKHVTSPRQMYWMDFEESIKLLLNSGASVETTDHQGRTALQWADERGITRVVNLLRGNAPQG